MARFLGGGWRLRLRGGCALADLFAFEGFVAVVGFLEVVGKGNVPLSTGKIVSRGLEEVGLGIPVNPDIGGVFVLNAYQDPNPATECFGEGDEE